MIIIQLVFPPESNKLIEGLQKYLVRSLSPNTNLSYNATPAIYSVLRIKQGLIYIFKIYI